MNISHLNVILKSHNEKSTGKNKHKIKFLLFSRSSHESSMAILSYRRFGKKKNKNSSSSLRGILDTSSTPITPRSASKERWRCERRTNSAVAQHSCGQSFGSCRPYTHDTINHARPLKVETGGAMKAFPTSAFNVHDFWLDGGKRKQEK